MRVDVTKTVCASGFRISCRDLILACLVLNAWILMHRRFRQLPVHYSIRAQSPPKCLVPVCIVARGPSDSEGFTALFTYAAAHPRVPVLFHSGRFFDDTNGLKVFNVESEDTRASIIRSLLEARNHDASIEATMNQMHAVAISHLKACSVFELDTRLSLVGHGDVLTKLGNSTWQLGVRPRGRDGTSADRATAAPNLPFVNAHTLFSPAVYYAPRGMPEELISDDQRGEGSNAPELIHVAIATPSAVVVIQSTIDGTPDVEPRFKVGQPINHRPIIDGIIIPSSIFHACDRRATLHTYDGMWALFSPADVDANAGDILRGYVAQAIFPIIGRHSALVSPVVEGTRSAHATSNKADGLNPDRAHFAWLPVLNYLASWSRDMQALCRGHATNTRDNPKDCQDAGTLLVRAYQDLVRVGHVSCNCLAAAKEWVRILRHSGYAMPKALVDESLKILSPPRPRQHSIHAAVHINWGNEWQGVVPLWHAMHAAEFKQVTYHLQRRPTLEDPSPLSSIYPHISFVLDDLAGVTSGYLAYESAIQAWGVHDLSTDAMLWTHEDAFVRGAFLSRWLAHSSTCVATGSVNYLPSKLSAWQSFWWRPWPQQKRTQIAARQFAGRIASPRCFGAGYGLPFGHADIVAVRTDCERHKLQRLFALLEAASDAELFMEIGWPASLRCAFPPDDVYEYNLYTRFDQRRNDPVGVWRAFLQNMHDAYHPVKLSPNLLTRLKMRDEGWREQAAWGGEKPIDWAHN